MRKLILAFACLLGLAGAAQAQTVTIDLDAGALENALGTTPEPVGGLLQLLASPSGTFSAPTSTSYATGDNVLVTSFPMNDNGGTAETFNALSGIPLTTTNYTLTAGESLELRFYPSLTYASAPAAPTLATTYGQVRSSTIEFGTSGGVPAETAWVVPAGGSTINLEYVTVSNGGTYANTTAFATNLVLIGSVPEPSAWGIMGGVLMSYMCMQAWKRRSATGSSVN